MKSKQNLLLTIICAVVIYQPLIIKAQDSIIGQISAIENNLIPKVCIDSVYNTYSI